MVPWWEQSATDFLEPMLNKNMVVFEYGSGHSTIWMAQRVKKIYTVEHQNKWFNQVQGWADNRYNLTNIELIFKPRKPAGPYCRAVQEVKEPIDLLVVDGRNRVESFFTAIPYLKENAIVVFDDTQRARYNKAKEFLDVAWEEHSWITPKPKSGKMARKTSVYLPKTKERDRNAREMV